MHTLASKPAPSPVPNPMTIHTHTSLDGSWNRFQNRVLISAISPVVIFFCSYVLYALRCALTKDTLRLQKIYSDHMTFFLLVSHLTVILILIPSLILSSTPVLTLAGAKFES